MTTFFVPFLKNSAAALYNLYPKLNGSLTKSKEAIFSYNDKNSDYLLVQFCSSSLLSKQSSSPSHTHDFGIHLWFEQVKSQLLGQACTGGWLGSARQLRPSSLRVSPYGQSHFAVRPLPSSLGRAKHNLLQPPLLFQQGWALSILCSDWL